MIVIYSDQTSGFLPGYAYRNPQYFQAPLGRPEKVIVMGYWPAVVGAYRAIGVEVEERPAVVGRMLRDPVELPPPPQSVTDNLSSHPLDHDGDGSPGGSLPADQRGDDVSALRAEYEALTGSTPDKRWGVPRLKSEIAKARS